MDRTAYEPQAVFSVFDFIVITSYIVCGDLDKASLYLQTLKAIGSREHSDDENH